MSEMNSHLPFELLSAYLDGEVRPAERSSVERHLAGCAHCREELDALRRTVSLLARLPERPAPRTFYITEAMVAPAPVAPPWWRRLLEAWQPLAAGASTLAALLLVALFVITPAATPAPEIASAPRIETVEEAAPAAESMAVEEPAEEPAADAASEPPAEAEAEEAAEEMVEETAEGEGEAATAQSPAPAAAAEEGAEIEPEEAVGLAATEIAGAPAAEAEPLEEAEPAEVAPDALEESEAMTEELELLTEQAELPETEVATESLADEPPTAADEAETSVEDLTALRSPSTAEIGVDEGALSEGRSATSGTVTSEPAAPLLGQRAAAALAALLLVIAVLLLASWSRSRGRA